MRPHHILAPVLAAFTAGCAIVFVERSVDEVASAPQTVESPVRAFLSDGSVVVFPSGAQVTDVAITGDGRRFDLLRNFSGGATAVPLDSVLGIEAFNERTDAGLSLIASLGATAVVGVGTVAAAKAIFGSCPTVYTVDEGQEVLESEAFSYSISPLLEARDTDRLSVAADSAGIVELEIRNEALETHYINHLELVEVRHGPEERILTDHENLLVSVGPLRRFRTVRDRSGRDVGGELSGRDDRIFSSSPERVSAAARGDERDWIEVTIPPVLADTAAVVLRLRNSLLNTVLFYDLMLGSQGARALDWMGRELESIGAAMELGAWYHEHMGLRLEVERAGAFEEVARLGDTGPIAWKQVAFPVPVRRGEPTPVRLSFLADAWRIDELAWSRRIDRPDDRVVPVSEVRSLLSETARSPAGQSERSDELKARVSAADDSYLVTSAGTGFTVRFDVGTPHGRERRTFLLSSQGYYTEWVRPRWIRSAEGDGPFRPTEDLIPELMSRWQEVKGSMEEAFYATRIPVR